MFALDPTTLRETVTNRAAFDDELAQLRAAQARGADVRAQLVPMMRIAGLLDDAERHARDFLGSLDPTLSPARTHAARLRLARVLTYRARFDDALRLFDIVVDQTSGALHASALFQRALCRFERAGPGDLLAARTDLDNCLAIREAIGAPADLLETTRVAAARIDRG